jgi:Ni,Fe-hydrogenase I large subunit
MEQAMIGIPYNAAAYPAGGAQFTKQGGGTQSTDGGVEALRVAQSFDPCIACAVH